RHTVAHQQETRVQLPSCETSSLFGLLRGRTPQCLCGSGCSESQFLRANHAKVPQENGCTQQARFPKRSGMPAKPTSAGKYGPSFPLRYGFFKCLSLNPPLLPTSWAAQTLPVTSASSAY